MALFHDFPVTCLWLILCLMADTEARSNGAPGADNCQAMTPQHGADPSTDEWPFAISFSDTTYTPGEILTVTLSGTNGKQMKGFMIQARSASVEQDEDGPIYGTFEETTLARVVCGNGAHGPGNCMTHRNPSEKSEIVLEWEAPYPGIGPVRFWVTTVEELRIFWNRIRSEVIDGPEGGEDNITTTITTPTTTTTTTPFTGSTTTAAPVPELDLTTCGNSKGCFREPASCEVSDCEYVVTWAREDESADIVNFELRISLDAGLKWIAMGLSRDTNMKDASVVDCIYSEEQGRVVVQASYNYDGYNEVLSDPQLGLVPGSTSGAYEDGVIRCRFSRYKSVTTRQDEDLVFPLDEEYHLLLAKGPTSEDDDMHKDQHAANGRLASADTFDVTSGDYGDAGGTTDQPLVKAHGSLMTFAWVAFVGLGVLMPRHFKPAWPEHKWGGLLIWFQIHRACMSMAFLLTISGFIIIFVHVGGYSQIPSLPGKAHPILGIIVTTLAVLNPIMALFRPHPGTPNRPVFNWAHFIVGQSGHILGVVTVYIGLDMRVSSEAGWVLVSFMVWHVLTEVTLALHGWSLRRNNRINKENQLEMKKELEGPDTQQKPSSLQSLDDTGRKKFSSSIIIGEQTMLLRKYPTAFGGTTPPHPTSFQGSAFKTAVLMVYICGNLAFAVTLVVMIGVS